MLNSSEAVYGFAAWLSTREKKIEVGASCDAAQLAEDVKVFCSVNNLPEVGKNWPNELIHPVD